MTKTLYGLRTSPKQWQEHLSTILQKMGFNRLKGDACIFANKQSSIYLMAYVDDLLQHLELKHTTQLTRSTSLEFLGKTIKLQDDGSIQLFFTPEYYKKILKPYKMEKCQSFDNSRQQEAAYCWTT
eukprot:5042047-Amphidinium_carterae.1